MAASACSQEDYSSTRCHRLPARPQRSSLNGNTQHKHTYTSLWMSPCRILVSISPVSSPPSFFPPRSTVLFLFPYLLFLHFPQLVPRLLFLTLYFYHFFSLTFSAVLSEQKRGHRQVTYAPIFRLLVLAFLQSHAWRRTSEEKLPLLLP